MKKIFNVLLVSLCCLISLNSGATVINGVLLDSQDTTALIEATVKLLKAAATSTSAR